MDLFGSWDWLAWAVSQEKGRTFCIHCVTTEILPKKQQLMLGQAKARHLELSAALPCT